MIGRKQELALLEKLYNAHSFQFLIMYGRRRVGKTTILQKFAQSHDCIFFPAQEKNDVLNLEDFSQTVQEHYTGDYLAPFPNWEKALAFIEKQSGTEKRTVLIIDEFPFLSAQNPSIKSIFQHAIDHSWQNKNIFLILCGSSVSFMINEVMGYKSPLYGRITAHLEVKPFDYLESAEFFPNYSQEEKLLAYGILGGIPRYLIAFNPAQDITQILPNIFCLKMPTFTTNRNSSCVWNCVNQAYTIVFSKPSPMALTRFQTLLTASTKTGANARNICKFYRTSGW